MRRVLTRFIKDRGRVREGLPDGCPEKIDWQFLRYVWNFNAKEVPRIMTALANDGPHVKLHRVGSDTEADRLLAELAAASPAGDGDARAG